MPLIKILPDQLRNQIAAGEVVERPASVVKELVENSIDAGATRIVVEIEEGGGKLIKITDNGRGMDREDARLALERHATSKISTEADLHTIGTMGFRGEALASIASVSQFVMNTAQEGDLEGTKVVCNGGLIEAVEPVGCPQGTQIEIKNLFFNTPARKKYLKTVLTEYQRILAIVTNAALAHPHIGFALIRDGRQAFDVPAETELLARVRALLGKNIADELIPVFFGGSDIKLTGFIGKPTIAKKSRSGQYLFVNKRAIQNSSLAFAVRDTFGSLLMDGNKPFFLLMLDIDPKLVDVNVHPRKTEVRFVDQRAIFRVIRNACKAALENNVLAPKISGDDGANVVARFDENALSSQRERASQQQWYADQQARRAKYSGESAASPQEAMAFTKSWSVSQKGSLLEGAMAQADQQVAVREHAPLVQSDSAQVYTSTSSLVPLVQVANSYIIAQNDAGLVLIDQHAAHERVLFAQFKKAWEDKTAATQPLLLPEQIELSHQEMAVLEANMETFVGLGFEIEAFGGNTFVVQAVPSESAKCNIQKLLIGILDELAQERKPKSAEERRIRILEYMACRTAIKFGDPLTHEEMVALIQQMETTENAIACPHGRPTMIELSFEDLEKKFGRH